MLFPPSHSSNEASAPEEVPLQDFASGSLNPPREAAPAGTPAQRAAVGSGSGNDVATLLRLLRRYAGSMAAALGTIVLACHICFQIEYTNARAAEAQAWAAAESARQLREVTARAGELARNVEALRLANQDIRSFLRELKAMVDELARMRPELDRLVSDRAADHRHILEQIHVLGGNLAVLQQKVSAAARRIDDLDKKTDQVPDLPSVKPEGATSPREVPSEVPPAPPAPKKNGYMIKPDPNAPRPPQDDTRGGYMH